MPRTELKLKLTRPAKSKGGDRYETTIEGEAKPMSIYLPQSITRPDGEPVESIEMTLDI